MSYQPSVTADAGVRHRGVSIKRRQNRTAVAYLMPALIGILLINIFPIIYTFYISLTNRNGAARFAEGNYAVTGFQNYGRLLSQANFYKVFGQTVAYAVVCVALFFVVGLVGAFSIVVFLILLTITLIYSRITNATKGMYE